MHAPPEAAGDRDGVGAPFAWALVALLALLHAATFMLTFVEGDFARDLHHATRVVEGGPWPMRGPVLAWTLHLGPLWYWLLVPPLAIARSVGAAVACVAILSALQFPLAYKLGTAVAGRTAGVAFAIALALPGLATLEGVWIAHPSLVPSTMLGVALCAWLAWTRTSPRWWVASVFVASLALHAHPTTLPVLALPLVAAARALRGSGTAAVGALVAGAIAFALPFAPLAFAPASSAAELSRFSATVAGDIGRLTFARWADALAAVAWRVPDAVAGATLAGRPGAPLVFRLALVVVLAAALAGLAIAWVRYHGALHRLAVVTAVAFTLTVALAVAVRDVTRFYMLYASWVVFAATLAVGLAALPSRRIGRVPLRLVPIAIALAMAVASASAWLLRARDGEVRVPAALSPGADLSRAVPRGYQSLVTLTPLDLDGIGGRLCAESEARALGELAGILDGLRNVPVRLACGDAARVVLGGIGLGAPWYLVPADVVPAGAAVDRYGGFALGRASAVHAPAQPLPIASGDGYPARAACGPPQPVTLRFATRGPGTLVIANALPTTCPLTLARVTRDGVAVKPAARLDAHVVALPPGESTWTVEASSGEARAVQAFTLGGGSE
jgi:hypothetical protein